MMQARRSLVLPTSSRIKATALEMLSASLKTTDHQAY
jgi:hypothetical protein